MKFITFSEIINLNITPQECVNWARDAIIHKREFVLPPKTSIKFNDNNSFFNTMPSMLPNQDSFGIKLVSRFPERTPSLKADILLYKASTGDLLAFMDGTWITTWRTGAVADITIDSLQSSKTETYSFVGLGNTARSTLLCLNTLNNNKKLNVQLLAYKNQHEDFIKRFSNFKNIHFTVLTDIKEMFRQSDVIISCITSTNTVLADESTFKAGTLIVPVHTRGFQNCDLTFDRIFCDDIGHIKDFKYFNQYKSVLEMTDVLNNSSFSRNDSERILAYNIGVSTQDIFFAKKIYDKISDEETLLNTKFWV